MFYSYLFEANSIQRFVFATGKLRDASGASELLASLAFEAPCGAGGLFPQVLNATGLTAYAGV